jgi:aspartyl-tRNA synthetase
MHNRVLIKDVVSHEGQEVKLLGWVDTRRDHGKLIFIDLRDRSGTVQIVATNPEKSFYKELEKVRQEWVIKATGVVKKRPDKMVNKNIATGSYEVEMTGLEILSQSQALPIPVEGEGYDIDEDARLKYRYLDLRRARLQKNIKLRHEVSQFIRKYLIERDFIEIETPLLTKSTPEGSRDFLVPSRLQPGKFYALPQSPQQYKQLLMVAGFERYFQLARALRDEDLRAHRGFEHTQLDLEMSFVEQQDVMKLVEGLMTALFEHFGKKIQRKPFPIISYKDAMKKYGADKFDMRSDDEKKENVAAFSWVIDFPFFKKPEHGNAAEEREGKSGWTFTHNPFSQPMSNSLEQHMSAGGGSSSGGKGEKVGEILTTQYDLVCNGYEIAGGSIRASDPEVLRATYKIMGYSESQIEESVGHMLEAFKYGTPPHGGIASGIERLCMVLTGEEAIREVQAFPQTSGGQTAVMNAPSPASKAQLDELGLEIKSTKHEARNSKQIKN